MPQKKPMSDAKLAAFEASQDLEALLVQSAREMGAGKMRKVYTPVVAPRENSGLSQAGFAELLDGRRVRCSSGSKVAAIRPVHRRR